MNETKNVNKLIIPIPPRHVVEKYRWFIFDISNRQRGYLMGGAAISMAAIGAASTLPFPFSLGGYLVTAAIAGLYYKKAWTHDLLIESEIMAQYWYYKRVGLMDISYTDTFDKIKTLFPYEIKNIINGIIHFGSGFYGIIITLSPNKLSPEEQIEFTPFVEALIDSLPADIMVKCRAKTITGNENMLEQMVFERLKEVKTKEEKAILFSLYDKAKNNEDNRMWKHTLFIGMRPADSDIEIYVQSILPGIIDMLENSRVMCMHIIDPVRILSHYSGDFSMNDEDSSKQSVMLVPNMSQVNVLSQLIRGGASFRKRQIFFNHEDYAALIIVGIPKDLVGGWPDDLKSRVLPQIYALSNSKEHTIEINVTVESIDSGSAVAEIKQVLGMIELNRLGDKASSNLMILAHSESKYRAMLERLQDGTINLNEVSYIVTVRAKSPDKLLAGISRVRAVFKAHSIKTQVAEGNMKEVFKATRFFPIRYPKLSTYMPTNAIAQVLPLINGAETIASSNPGKYCVYFADDIHTGRELCFNLGDMGAATHAIGFGASQSGKTTFLSVIGMRMVTAGIGVIYTTVKADGNTKYVNVARHFKERGEIIYLGRPPIDKSDPNYAFYKNINPLQILFDPSMAFDVEQTFFHHVGIVKQFVNQICSSGVSTEQLNPLQLAYIERSLMRLYAKFGIKPNDHTTWTQDNQPVLLDLYNIWNADKDTDAREALQAAAIEARTTSITHNWRFLSTKTNLSLDKDYIVIDMSTLPGDLVNAMNYFMTAIIALRFRSDVKHKHVVMVDEGRAFMKSGMGEAIVKMATQGASGGVSVFFTSQQPADMVGISAELLNNAPIRFVMGKNTEVPEVAASLRLAKSDSKFLESCTKSGQLLLQMKSPFNKTYHCELNLSALETEVLFGKKQEASVTFEFMNPALMEFAKDRGFVLADWVQKNNLTSTLTKDMIKMPVQKGIGAGKVWAYIPNNLISETGLIKLQSPDHYYSVASIAGWFIGQDIATVVNDGEGVDIVVTLPNGKTLGIEYQTSLPGNNREETIMEKWKNGENKYNLLLFVSDTTGVAEIKQITKSDEIVISRGSKLETRLTEIISQNQN